MKEVGLKRAVDAAKEFLLQKHRGHKQHGLSSDCKGLQLRGMKCRGWNGRGELLRATLKTWTAPQATAERTHDGWLLSRKDPCSSNRPPALYGKVTEYMQPALQATTPHLKCSYVLFVWGFLLFFLSYIFKHTS